MSEKKTKINDAVAAIIGELAKVGVSKDKKATGFGAGYNFRGIDDVQVAMAPLLAKHKVTITPTVKSCDMTVRATSKGTSMYHALLWVEYTVSHGNESYTGVALGEAADVGDKAVGKAMSYAYKSFCLQAFCVPTKGSAAEDPDNTIHEPTNPVVEEKPAPAQSQSPPLDVKKEGAEVRRLLSDGISRSKIILSNIESANQAFGVMKKLGEHHGWTAKEKTFAFNHLKERLLKCHIVWDKTEKLWIQEGDEIPI